MSACALESATLPLQKRKWAEGPDDVGVMRSQLSLADLERTLETRVGGIQLAELRLQPGQTDQPVGDLRVIGTEGTLGQSDRPLSELPRFVLVAQTGLERGAVTEVSPDPVEGTLSAHVAWYFWSCGR